MISRRRVMAAATTAALIGALAYAQVLRERRALHTFDIAIERAPFHSTASGSLAMSGDGRLVAYVFRDFAATPDMKAELALWRYDDFFLGQLPETEDASGPFFSPDGQWVGFAAHGMLRKVPTSGGPGIALCTLDGELRGASWASDGEIYFATSAGARGGPIRHVPATGGQPRDVSPLPAGEIAERWPQVLPGGRSLLYTAEDRSGARFIHVLNLATGERRRVTDGESASYVATGHLIFIAHDGIRAGPFDRASSQLTAPAEIIGALPQRTGDASQFAVSETGSVIVAPPGIDLPPVLPELVWVSRAGERTAIGPAPAAYRSVALAPDGVRVAYQVGPSCQTYVYDPRNHQLTPLPFPAVCSTFTWTPDGSRVTYRCPDPAGGSDGVCWAPADGSGPGAQLVQAGADSLTPKAWTGDGRVLTVNDDQGFAYIWNRDRRELQPILNSKRSGSLRATWDGALIAFTRSGLAGRDLYIAPAFSGTNPVSLGRMGAAAPRWRRDGRELFFIVHTAIDNVFMAVTITTTPGLAISTPVALFHGNYDGIYDVAPDGQRLAAIYNPPARERPHLVVTQNAAARLLR